MSAFHQSGVKQFAYAHHKLSNAFNLRYPKLFGKANYCVGKPQFQGILASHFNKDNWLRNFAALP